MTAITSTLFSGTYHRAAKTRQERTKGTGSPSPAAKGATRILLVDDDALLVACQAAVLERYGHLVTATSDPFDALALVRANPSSFDVVISDLIMPGLDGVELSAQINALSPSLPIIMLTATPQECNLDQDGIRKILAKPTPSLEIHATIIEVLELERSASAQLSSASALVAAGER